MERANNVNIDILSKSNLDFIVGEPRLVEGKDDSQTEYKFLHLLQMPEVEEHIEVSHNSKLLEPRNVKRTVNGSIYTSNMTTFEVELYGSHDFTNEEINIRRGLSHPDFDNNTIQWIDYGNFIVQSSEFDTLEEVTTLQSSDYMIKTQVPYKKEDMNLSFPTSVKTVFNRVLEVLGLETSTTSFTHDDITLAYDLWADTSYTYRDVLDHIAELSSSIIAIRDNKVEVFKPEETGVRLTLDKAKKIEWLGDYGKINIVNITQEPQHSNTPYPPTWNEIPQDERKELAFANNPIFDTNQEKYGELIFDNVNDLSFKQATSEMFGYGVFEIGDIIEVPDPQTGEYHKTVLSFEETAFGGFPSSEQRYLKPLQAEDDYVVETDEKRANQETYILIDKANGQITLANERVDDLSESVSQIEISMDEILLLLEQRNSTNLWINSSGVMGVDTYTFDVEPIIMNDEDYPMVMAMTDYTMGRTDHLFKAIPYPSLAENAFAIDRTGTALSAKKYLVFKEPLYFHTKIKGNPHNKNYVGFKLIEYDKDKIKINEQDLGEHKPTRDMYHFKKKVEPLSNTEYIAIEIRGRGTTPNPVMLTEGMLSYTDYAPFDTSSNDVLEYTKSQIEIMEGEINLTSQSVDSLNNDIHNAGVEINAKDGITTYGKKFSIMNSDKTKELLGVTTIDGEETIKIDISGGSLGNMELDNGKMVITSPEYEKQYTQSDVSAIRVIINSGSSGNGYEKFVYDFNNDGKVDHMDYIQLRNYLNGSGTIHTRMIQSQVEIGNQQGQIISRILYDGGKRGNETLIQADSIQTGTIEAKGLSIGGKSVEADSNGFLKLV